MTFVAIIEAIFYLIFLLCIALSEVTQICRNFLSFELTAIRAEHHNEFALFLPVFIKVLRSWHFHIAPLSHACIGVASKACIEVRVSIVVDEFFGAQIALELRLGKKVGYECIEALRGSILFLAVRTVALLFEVCHHALVAEQVVAFRTLLSVFHDIGTELANQEVNERFFGDCLALGNDNAVVDLDFLRL